MALFKILKGNYENLPKTEFHEGYMYITEDTGNIYIDLVTKTFSEPPSEIGRYRMQLNANAAYYLRNGGSVEVYDYNTITELINKIDDIEIASIEVKESLAQLIEEIIGEEGSFADSRIDKLSLSLDQTLTYTILETVQFSGLNTSSDTSAALGVAILGSMVLGTK